MDYDVILLTNKQLELFNLLKTYVSMIKKGNTLKFLCGYYSKYYDTLYRNYEDIIYFVKHFSKNVLNEILLQDDLEKFLILYND